jgi:hypothetical protein
MVLAMLLLGLSLSGPSLKISLATDAVRRDCVMLPSIVTSELSLQLFAVPTAAGLGLVPLADREVELSSSKRREWSVKTDTRGYVRFPDLPPGDYRLHVPFTIEPLIQDVRVVRSGPRRMIVAIANVACGTVCSVFAHGPLAEPPPCLYRRQILYNFIGL